MTFFRKTKFKYVTATVLLAGSVAPSALPLIQPIVVHADDSDSNNVDSIISRIDSLPPTEDLNDSHAQEVKALMSAYSELSTADRIKVKNFSVLEEAFNDLVDKGVLTNEDNTVLQEKEAQKKKQENKKLSGDAASEEKEYTFSSDGKTPITIMIRYTTDADGDGVGDVPQRIVLTSPDGTTYPVSNTSLAMSDGDNLKVELSWTDLYLQMDFQHFAEGNWTIETSQAVTFSSKPYTGETHKVKAEDENKSNKEEKKTTKKKKNPLVLIFILGLVGGLGFYGYKKLKEFTGGTSAPTVDEDALSKTNEPQQLTDEEQLAMLKEELKLQNKEMGFNFNEDNNDNQIEFGPNRYSSPRTNTPASNRYDDDDDPTEYETKNKGTFEDDLEEGLEMHAEGETGILKPEDKPVHQIKDSDDDSDDDDSGIDQTSDFMNGFGL